MNFESKYHLGQKVWAVSRSSFKRLVNCYPCKATGKVKIGDEEFVCPKCGGSSSYPQNAGEKCYVNLSSRIGKIEIVAYKEAFFDEPPLQVKYMLEATGVGSGQVWKEEDLFFSEEEAQAFCDASNLKIPQDEQGAERLPQLISVSSPFEFSGA